MDALKSVSQACKSADEILIDDCSRIVFMSDCHRGDGEWYDDFSKNQNLYFAALSHYYKKGYTYIEIGDGDELWETNNLNNIIYTHSDVFWLMSKFYDDGRLYFIFGNHDIVKKNNKFVIDNLYQYFDERKKIYKPLFKNVKLHEALVLRYKEADNKILLVHGHQVDYLNNKLWKLSRLLVRYLWKPLETIGVNDPTRTARNYKKKGLVEKRLIEWIKKEHYMIIAGHTHRPVFPEVGELPYFNDGSCVHPRCITAIEIFEGDIYLVKWSVKTKIDGTLYIGRDVLAGPRKLGDYFKIWSTNN